MLFEGRGICLQLFGGVVNYSFKVFDIPDKPSAELVTSLGRPDDLSDELLASATFEHAGPADKSKTQATQLQRAVQGAILFQCHLISYKTLIGLLCMHQSSYVYISYKFVTHYNHH